MKHALIIAAALFAAAPAWANPPSYDSSWTSKEAADAAVSTAQDGTVANFTRDNTLVVSSTTFYPVYLSPHAVYVQQLEEQIEPQFLPR
jgi:hypothetical protein